MGRGKIAMAKRIGAIIVYKRIKLHGKQE